MANSLPSRVFSCAEKEEEQRSSRVAENARKVDGFRTKRIGSFGGVLCDYFVIRFKRSEEVLAMAEMKEDKGVSGW